MNFFASPTWRYTKKIINRQEEIIIGGLATGGSVFSAFLGLTVIASHILALPLIAGGSLLTSFVLGVGYLILGLFGGYFSIHNLTKSIDAWKAKLARYKNWRRRSQD